MIVPRTQRLRVRRGEQLSAAKFNGMLDLMDEIIRTIPGAGVKSIQLPNARILKAIGGGGGGSASASGFPFQTIVGAGEDDGELEAVFNLGLIAGVKPKIGPGDNDLPIDDDSSPSYKFQTSDVIDADTGIGMLYWQLEFNIDFSIKKIYPVALNAPPKKEDYKGWKLIGFLVNPVGDTESTPTWMQMMYHNLNHVASQRAGGKAKHTFWAVS